MWVSGSHLEKGVDGRWASGYGKPAIKSASWHQVTITKQLLKEFALAVKDLEIEAPHENLSHASKKMTKWCSFPLSCFIDLFLSPLHNYMIFP